VSHIEQIHTTVIPGGTTHSKVTKSIFDSKAQTKPVYMVMMPINKVQEITVTVSMKREASN
jgi:hypothetical protein